MQLQGKHVVVVGGSSGIGFGVAKAALAAGAQVTLASRTAERLEQARMQLCANGEVRTVPMDISREADVIRLYRESGPIDHLVVTAVTVAYQPIEEFDLDAARRVVDSKLIGPWLLAKHGKRALQPGGSITLTSGIAAYRPSVRGSMVAAVNGALAALGRALAVELAPLRVNVISPGWVDTPVWDTFAGDRKAEMLAGMANRLLTGRIGTPTDIAHAVLFLMASEHTTGTVLHVDGGQRLV